MRKIMAVVLFYAFLSMPAGAESNAVNTKNFKNAFDLNIEHDSPIKEDLKEQVCCKNLDSFYTPPPLDDEEEVHIKPEFRYVDSEEYAPRLDQKATEFKLNVGVGF